MGWGGSSFLFCVVTSFPSLFIVSDEVLGRQLPGFVIPISVSPSGSGLSIVCCTQTPPGAPGNFNGHLETEPMNNCRVPGAKRCGPPGCPGAEEPLKCVCGNAGFPNDFFRKSTV